MRNPRLSCLCYLTELPCKHPLEMLFTIMPMYIASPILLANLWVAETVSGVLLQGA